MFMCMLQGLHQQQKQGETCRKCRVSVYISVGHVCGAVIVYVAHLMSDLQCSSYSGSMW